MEKEKQAFNYHDRVMNIRINDELKNIEMRKGGGYEMMYKVGHRDARHLAEEIAIEADQEIAAIKDENEKLKNELNHVRFGELMSAHRKIERKDEALKYIVDVIKNQQNDNWLNQDLPEYVANLIQDKAEQSLKDGE